MLGLPTFWLDEVRAWASLSERPLQNGGDVARCVLLDMPLSTYLGYHRLVLILVDGETSTKLVQEGSQLARVDAGCSEDLEGTTFNAHDKVSFIGGALTHHLVPRQHGIDALSRSPGKCQHLCHALKTCFFFQVCKS